MQAPTQSTTETAASGNLARTKYILGRSMIGAAQDPVPRVLRPGLRTGTRTGALPSPAAAITRIQYLAQKREFVRRVLENARAAWVLDVGANTGEFSEMAAAHSRVVAIDLDEVSVSAIYARARSRPEGHPTASCQHHATYTGGGVEVRRAKIVPISSHRSLQSWR